MFILFEHAVYSFLEAEADERHINQGVFLVVEVTLHSSIVHLLHHKLGVLFVKTQRGLLILGEEDDSRGALVQSMQQIHILLL